MRADRLMRADCSIRPRRHPRHEAGFSLIESLVATVIAAAVLAAFFSAGSAAGALQYRAGRNAAAIAIAHDLARTVGTEIPAVHGSRSGVAADGSAWRIDIQPLPVVIIGGQPSAMKGLVSARIRVAGKGGEAELTLVRPEAR